MTDAKTVGVRLEGDTLVRVEDHRVRLQVGAGTIKVTLSDAVRDIILLGLHAADGDESKANQS